MKRRLVALLLAALMGEGLASVEVFGVDSSPLLQRKPQPVERAAALKPRRLTPEERRQLLSRLTHPAAEAQRRATNSAPRKVTGGTDRLAQRLNAALRH